ADFKLDLCQDELAMAILSGDKEAAIPNVCKQNKIVRRWCSSGLSANKDQKIGPIAYYLMQKMK
ncbi:unnamed protein product, partial [Amoebophrya sp. A120]